MTTDVVPQQLRLLSSRTPTTTIRSCCCELSKGGYAVDSERVDDRAASSRRRSRALGPDRHRLDVARVRRPAGAGDARRARRRSAVHRDLGNAERGGRGRGAACRCARLPVEGSAAAFRARRSSARCARPGMRRPRLAAERELRLSARSAFAPAFELAPEAMLTYDLGATRDRRGEPTRARRCSAARSRSCRTASELSPRVSARWPRVGRRPSKRIADSAATPVMFEWVVPSRRRDDPRRGAIRAPAARRASCCA